MSFGALPLGDLLKTDGVYDSPALDLLLNLRLPGKQLSKPRDLMTISVPSKTAKNS